MNDVVAPFVESPSNESLFKPDGLPNWQLMVEIYKGEGKLTKSQSMRIMQSAQAILLKEPNTQRVSFPATIYGDIHG